MGFDARSQKSNCCLPFNRQSFIQGKFSRAITFLSNLPKSIFCHQIHQIPLPLCKPIRKRRATLLSEIADIGYNATKKEHYYGVKLSIFITELGFSVNYVVSAASVHDIQMVKISAQTTPSPQIIGDKGYLSKDLKTELAQIGITITTPIRKNMTGADKVDDCLFGKRRKAIETVFSSLETLGMQAFKSRSLQDFEFRLIMRIWTRHPL